MPEIPPYPIKNPERNRSPTPPKRGDPSGFNQQLEDKVTAIAALLQADEIERIRRVMPGFSAAMESNDVDVMLMIRDLLQRPPEVIAGWLRAHLDVVERRFAS